MSMLARLAAMGSGIAVAATPTFIGSSSGVGSAATTVATSAPSGIQDGDLLILIGTAAGTPTSVTAPAGFTVVLYERGTLSNSIFIATKIAASESGTYTATWGSSETSTLVMLAYRNATKINTIGTSTRVLSATDAAPAITPTFTGRLCALYAFSSNRSVLSAPSGMTSRLVQSSVSPSVAVYDQALSAGVSSGTKTLTWSGTSGYSMGVLFQVTNESSVAPDFVSSAVNQVTLNNQASFSIPKPSGTIEGDLMIAIASHATTSGGGATASWSPVPTGWTQIANQQAAPDLMVAYKIATASEGASYAFGIATGTMDKPSGAILTYRYASFGAITSLATGANPLTLAELTPTLSQAILLAVASNAASSVTLGTPLGMAARITDNDANGPSYIVCDQSVPSGPTRTRSIATGATANVVGAMLTLLPTRTPV